MIVDEGCFERGCACHDSRESPGVVVVKREWRGLTDTERAKVQYESFKRGLSPLEFMELHEAALKEKNHDEG
jgi:hypothetical protein